MQIKKIELVGVSDEHINMKALVETDSEFSVEGNILLMNDFSIKCEGALKQYHEDVVEALYQPDNAAIIEGVLSSIQK